MNINNQHIHNFFGIHDVKSEIRPEHAARIPVNDTEVPKEEINTQTDSQSTNLENNK
jgi:hypothetical protein